MAHPNFLSAERIKCREQRAEQIECRVQRAEQIECREQSAELAFPCGEGGPRSGG